MKIAVMGGSFNPPTIAHLRLIQAALDALDAPTGYLVPVSFPYLKRKMLRAGCGHMCIPTQARLEMLRAMCEGDGRIQIYEGEIDAPFSVTERTMAAIQARHPGAEICFVSGADKLDLLEQFVWNWDFLFKYRAVIFARNGEDLKEQLRDFPGLTAFRGSITVAPTPEGIEDVSATAVRAHLFDADAVADMLHPAVLSLVKRLRRADFPEEIVEFKGDWAFLSGKFPSPVVYEGATYPSAEAAFQASKSDDPAVRRLFTTVSAERARMKGNQLSPVPGWEARQEDILRQITRLKFLQNPELRDRLLATGNRRLINGDRKDEYWGVNPITWAGENRLGQILMAIREELKTDVEQSFSKLALVISAILLYNWYTT